jgi:hypothetical protein
MNSSLFCWGSTTDTKRDTVSSTIDPVRYFSEARPNRVKRRQTHIKHSVRSNIPVADHEAREPFREKSPDTSLLRRNSPTAIASVIAGSMSNNASASVAPARPSQHTTSPSHGDLETYNTAPANRNVTLAAEGHRFSLANARWRDSRPALVRSALPAEIQGSNEEQHQSSFVPGSPKHAEAARARCGFKRVAAGETETGWYAA